MTKSWLTFDGCCSNCGSKLRTVEDRTRATAADSEKLYTEAEHQAEIAALVRKITALLRAYGNEINKQNIRSGYVTSIGDDMAKRVETVLTPPMESALAEHDVGIRAECNGEWLNMIARLFGPIPCGGTSLEIAERHLVEHDKRLRQKWESTCRCKPEWEGYCPLHGWGTKHLAAEHEAQVRAEAIQEVCNLITVEEYATRGGHQIHRVAIAGYVLRAKKGGHSKNLNKANRLKEHITKALLGEPAKVEHPDGL